MNKIDKKSLIYVSIITIFIIFYYACFNFISDVLAVYVIPIFWILFTSISLIINKKFSIKKRVVLDNYQIIFIVVITYLILYFLSGIVFGYNKNFYSYDFNSIIKNLWEILIVLICQEYIRYDILNNSRRSKFIFIYTLIIFTVLNINLFVFFNTSSLFKNICSVFIPTIAINLLMNYLALENDYKSCLIYRVPICLFQILSPIIPNINWFFKSIFDIFLCFIIFILIRKIKYKSEKKYTNKFDYIKNIIAGLIFAAIISFFAGFLHYKPIVIMSNSMKGTFSKGDIVIVEKINSKNIDSLKRNDIIEYKLNNTSIIHRIIDVKDDINKKLFITKGDNNKSSDKEPVRSNQIVSKVKFSIPKLGYPSVYFKELIKNIKE